MRTGLLIAIVCMGQVLQAPDRDDVPTESVEIRYARAQVELVEANLRRVQESNKRVDRAVPRSVVEEYQQDVAVAKTRFEHAASGGDATDFHVWLRRAASERRAAHTAWRSAVAANRRAQGTFDPLDVERFRLRAEVAKLQLERGRALVDAGREAQIQWQVDLLDNQVQRLNEEFRRSAPYLGSYPPWWW